MIEKDSDTNILELLQAAALERTMRTRLRVYIRLTDELSKTSPRVKFSLAIDEILDNPISELWVPVEGNGLTESGSKQRLTGMRTVFMPSSWN